MQVTHRGVKFNSVIPLKTNSSRWNIFARQRYVKTLGDAADLISELGDKAKEPHWTSAIEWIKAVDRPNPPFIDVATTMVAIFEAVMRDGLLQR